MKRMTKSEWDKLNDDEKLYREVEFKLYRENFRQRLLWVSRGFALLLIFGIFWVGFVQFNYVMEVNEIRGDMGPQAWCYLCGKETLKKCECQYFDQDLIEAGLYDIEKVRNETMDYNKQKCMLSKTGFDLTNQNITIKV